MKEATHKEISEYIGKSLNTVNGWTNKFPKLLAIVKLGAFCKKNNLNIEKIKKLVELQEMIKEKS
jgi:hypothetical protein